VLQANKAIAAFSRTLPPHEDTQLPGCAFAVAQFTTENINIIQGSDTRAVWKMRDGNTGSTHHQKIAYEHAIIANLSTLVQKHGDMATAWKLGHYDFELGFHRKYINNYLLKNPAWGFAFLNGESKVAKAWNFYTLPRQEVEILILFSDGFIPFELTTDHDRMESTILTLYEKGGLPYILKYTRQQAPPAEATAVAVEF
jgi:hypothetical protein